MYLLFFLYYLSLFSPRSVYITGIRFTALFSKTITPPSRGCMLCTPPPGFDKIVDAYCSTGISDRSDRSPLHDLEQTDISRRRSVPDLYGLHELRFAGWEEPAVQSA